MINNETNWPGCCEMIQTSIRPTRNASFQPPAPMNTITSEVVACSDKEHFVPSSTSSASAARMLPDSVQGSATQNIYIIIS